MLEREKQGMEMDKTGVDVGEGEGINYKYYRPRGNLNRNNVKSKIRDYDGCKTQHKKAQ